MQHLEVSGAVQPTYGSLGVKRLRNVLQDQHQYSPAEILHIERSINHHEQKV